MIDIRKLKELVRLMVENDLSELDLRDKEEKVTLKRGPGEAMVSYLPMGHAPQYAAQAPSARPVGEDAGDAESAGAGSTEGLVAIESPMVGTFYSAGNPEADPFVTAGSNVSSGTTVCLVEAMKVFNEIKSEVSGTIERVLVSNGDSVEFGQKLFLVRPS